MRLVAGSMPIEKDGAKNHSDSKAALAVIRVHPIQLSENTLQGW
jgi:hypothetical protein